MRVIATAISNVCNNLADLLSWPPQSEDALCTELFGPVMHIEQLLEHHNKYCESKQTVLQHMDEVEDHVCTQLSNICHLLHFIEQYFGKTQWHIEERLAKLTANIVHNNCTLQLIANQVTTLVNVHGTSHSKLNTHIGQLSTQLVTMAGESFQGSFCTHTNKDSTAAVQAMPKYLQIQTWTAPQWTSLSLTCSGVLLLLLPPCALTEQLQHPVLAVAAAHLHISTYY
jgi:hypothetical protein